MSLSSADPCRQGVTFRDIVADASTVCSSWKQFTYQSAVLPISSTFLGRLRSLNYDFFLTEKTKPGGSEYQWGIYRTADLTEVTSTNYSRSFSICAVSNDGARLAVSRWSVNRLIIRVLDLPSFEAVNEFCVLFNFAFFLPDSDRLVTIRTTDDPDDKREGDLIVWSVSSSRVDKLLSRKVPTRGFQKGTAGKDFAYLFYCDSSGSPRIACYSTPDFGYLKSFTYSDIRDTRIFCKNRDSILLLSKPKPSAFHSLWHSLWHSLCNELTLGIRRPEPRVDNLVRVVNLLTGKTISIRHVDANIQYVTALDDELYLIHPCLDGGVQFCDIRRNSVTRFSISEFMHEPAQVKFSLGPDMIATPRDIIFHATEQEDHRVAGYQAKLVKISLKG